MKGALPRVQRLTICTEDGIVSHICQKYWTLVKLKSIKDLSLYVRWTDFVRCKLWTCLGGKYLMLINADSARAITLHIHTLDNVQLLLVILHHLKSESHKDRLLSRSLKIGDLQRLLFSYTQLQPPFLSPVGAPDYLWHSASDLLCLYINYMVFLPGKCIIREFLTHLMSGGDGYSYERQD